MKLYSYLEHLGERALFYDTDSIIYVSNRDMHEYVPLTGTLLGEMTDELSCYGTGCYITSFVSGGPKFYAYKVKKPDGTESCTCKVKGCNNAGFVPQLGYAYREACEATTHLDT